MLPYVRILLKYLEVVYSGLAISCYSVQSSCPTAYPSWISRQWRVSTGSFYRLWVLWPITSTSETWLVLYLVLQRVESRPIWSCLCLQPNDEGHMQISGYDMQPQRSQRLFYQRSSQERYFVDASLCILAKDAVFNPKQYVFLQRVSELYNVSHVLLSSYLAFSGVCSNSDIHGFMILVCHVTVYFETIIHFVEQCSETCPT